MGSEIKSLIQVWITVYAALTFCYFIIRKLPKGKIRLISLLPIISLFTYLPLNLSSTHFAGVTSFFITWLANFKLLLMAFDKGPLSSNPSISLIHFISIACLPIKIKTPKTTPSLETINKGLKSPTNYLIKFFLLALIIYLYNYKQYMNQKFILILYCCHIYLSVEIVLVMFGAPAKAILGFDIEPQFEEPYLSTSLQDFWGRRWNLMVTSILRPTVYDPVKSISTRLMGRYYASLPAVMATFVVSGLMHELIYYYLARVEPTWEVTWFFLLHGFCVVLEIAAKKVANGRWRLHPGISGPLVIGFTAATSFWLFFPQLVRNGLDVKAIREYAEGIQFVKDLFHPLINYVSQPSKV